MVGIHQRRALLFICLVVLTVTGVGCSFALPMAGVAKLSGLLVVFFLAGGCFIAGSATDKYNERKVAEQIAETEGGTYCGDDENWILFVDGEIIFNGEFAPSESYHAGGHCYTAPPPFECTTDGAIISTADPDEDYPYDIPPHLCHLYYKSSSSQTKLTGLYKKRLAAYQIAGETRRRNGPGVTTRSKRDTQFHYKGDGW